ncbi:MAG: sugar-binding protein [bacterium]
MKKIKILSTVLLSLLLILMISSPSEAVSKTGLLMVGETSVAPKIDGKLNDACWKNTIEGSPFILKNQDKFAKEQTKAYLCYDKDNLYLAFKCEASILDPVNNQLHAFKKDVLVNDDDKLFGDDCIVILLDTNRDKNTFFDIIINGQGAINDAKCGGKNPWGSRDKTWNSNAKISTRIENGYWVAEMSIPFSSLNTTVKEKDSWRVCLGRIEQNKKETSLWQPMETGFHNAKEFGRIVFGKGVPRVSSVKMGNFNRGKNKLTAEIIPQRPNASLRIETTIKFAKGGKKRAFQDYKLAGKKQLNYNYSLDKDGEFSFQYRILDPATFKVYYRSPLYSASVKSSVLKADISAESAYKLYVNEEEIEKEAPLVKGENIIEIKTERPVKGEFSVGDFGFTVDDTWEKGKGYLRKIILLNSSRFWPNWEKGGVSIAQNSIQQLFLVPEGIKGRTLTDYSFFLEVPEEFNVLGASSYYGWLPVSCQEQGIVKRNKKNYKKYLITTPKSIPVHRPIRNSAQFCSILVQLPVLEKKFASDKTIFYYYLKAEKGNIEEVPQKLKVNILPPLRGKQPKKYTWLLGTSWLSRMNDKTCQDYVVSSFIDAGFNDILYAKTIPAGINLRIAAMINFDSWNINCEPYLSEHPEEALLDNEGMRRFVPGNSRKNQICATLLLEDSLAWKYVEKKIGAWVKGKELGHINWDFESSPWGSQISCYCPSCLEKFKEFAQIDSSIKLTPEIIHPDKKDYRDEWIKFMNMRMALISGKMREAVKKANPEAIFSVYSGYQSDLHKEHCGTDWSMLADKVDLAICGYGRPEKLIVETLKVLGKTPLVAGQLVYPYDIKKQEYPAFASKAILLRRAVDGTGGIMIWTLTELDGRTFYASAEISRLVADYENLFVSHQKDNSLVEVSGMSPDDVTVFTDGKTRLILVINEDNVKKKVKVVNEKFDQKMKVYDYYQEKNLGNLKEIETEILPQDVKAFVVTAGEE